MPKTKELKYGDDTITIARPRYNQMVKISGLIANLTDMDTVTAIMQHEDFLKVMEAACATAKDFKTFQELDYEDAYSAWLEYLELGRFDDFLSEASQQLAERKLRLMEVQLETTRKQIELMKKTGALPSDFSLEDAMKDASGGGIPELLASGSAMRGKPDVKTK